SHITCRPRTGGVFVSGQGILFGGRTLAMRPSPNGQPSGAPPGEGELSHRRATINSTRRIRNALWCGRAESYHPDHTRVNGMVKERYRAPNAINLSRTFVAPQGFGEFGPGLGQERVGFGPALAYPRFDAVRPVRVHCQGPQRSPGSGLPQPA